MLSQPAGCLQVKNTHSHPNDSMTFDNDILKKQSNSWTFGTEQSALSSRIFQHIFCICSTYPLLREPRRNTSNVIDSMFLNLCFMHSKFENWTF